MANLPLSVTGLNASLPKQVLRSPTPKDKEELAEHEGFLRGKTDGPFRCDHCQYYIAGRGVCQHVIVVGWAKEHKYGLELVDKKYAKVNPDDCSDYFKRAAR